MEDPDEDGRGVGVKMGVAYSSVFFSQKLTVRHDGFLGFRNGRAGRDLEKITAATGPVPELVTFLNTFNANSAWR